MRASRRARWAICALAISLWGPASADRAPRTLARCTTFDQVEKAEARVEFTIRNTCSIPVDCSVTWRVVCAPDSKKRRAEHPSRASFALASGTSQSAEASVAVCGDDAWTIDSVHWSCQPNKD